MLRKYTFIIPILLLCFFVASCAGTPPKRKPLKTDYGSFKPVDLNPLLKDCRYVAKVDNFVVIMDASFSMAFPPEEQVKFNYAKEIIRRMNLTIPGISVQGGIRIFGPGRISRQSDQESTLIYGMTKYETASFEEALMAFTCSGGDESHLSTALDETRLDLKKLKGTTAVIIIGDGEDTGTPVYAVKQMKKAYGDRVCIYTISLADHPRGQKTLDEVAVNGTCGFSVDAASIASPDAMAEYVTKVFLEKSVDSDGDGVYDPCDKCPKDPNKTEPGVCGCGTPDIDSDGDGVYDCHDKCPGTPPGAKVDEKGCWILGTVQFDLDKWFIKPQYFEMLDDIAGVLIMNRDVKLELHGHTCIIWTEQYNVKLSLLRADSVKKYLVDKGVSPDQLIIKGFGLTKPKHSNEKESSRSLNRRTEILRAPTQ